MSDAAASGAGIERLKSLAGTWIGESEHDGQKHTVESRWRVTAAGTAVEETLMAGTTHEMVSMFHRDGAGLMMTHYCAVGNQPRMLAVSDEKAVAAGRLEFEFVDGTNLDGAPLHMGHVIFEIVSKDELRETWTAYKDGKADHTAQFTLRRKS